jgi:hypothetical protein
MSIPLTQAEITAIKARIVKFEAAYDDIISGKAIKRFVDQNGEQVEYTAANAAKLLAFINELKAMIDSTFARRYKPRPIGFVFPRQ